MELEMKFVLAQWFHINFYYKQAVTNRYGFSFSEKRSKNKRTFEDGGCIYGRKTDDIFKAVN